MRRNVWQRSGGAVLSSRKTAYGWVQLNSFWGFFWFLLSSTWWLNWLASSDRHLKETVSHILADQGKRLVQSQAGWLWPLRPAHKQHPPATVGSRDSNAAPAPAPLLSGRARRNISLSSHNITLMAVGFLKMWVFSLVNSVQLLLTFPVLNIVLHYIAWH